MNRPAKLQRLYQNFPVAETGHDEEPWCSPSCIQCSRAGSSLQETQPAKSPAPFGTDWTVRFARPSAVRKADHSRFPGCPASLLKIVIGKSTCAPVSGPHISASPSFGPLPAAGDGQQARDHQNLPHPKMPVSADHKVNDSRITMFRTALKLSLLVDINRHGVPPDRKSWNRNGALNVREMQKG